MKKWISYLLICTYLLTFPEARQILKFPTFVEHFISHKLTDPATTIYSFIKMHYLDAPVKDADYAQDQKLPFKTHDISVSAFSITTPPKKVEFNFEHKCPNIEEQHTFAYSESFYPSVFQKIWQPPKI